MRRSGLPRIKVPGSWGVVGAISTYHHMLVRRVAGSIAQEHSADFPQPKGQEPKKKLELRPRIGSHSRWSLSNGCYQHASYFVTPKRVVDFKVDGTPRSVPHVYALFHPLVCTNPSKQC